VWVDGTNAAEVYVIDVETKQKIRTIEGIKTTKILAVQNFAKIQQAKEQQEAVAAAIKAAMDAQMSSSSSSEDIMMSSESSSSSSDPSMVTAMAKDDANPPTKDDDNDIDAVGVIGLIVGACALIVGTMNVFVMSSMKNQITTNKSDLISLGSKDVA